MSANVTSLPTAHYILIARGFVFILGCIGVWWGVVGFPIFWRDFSPEHIADRIIAGDPFKAEVLAKQLPVIDSAETSVYCRPAMLRSAAIIQLRMVEAAASANDREHIDEHFNSLAKVTRSSLSCAPADSFLWLVLYWVESTKNSSKPDYLKYLRMSYRLGPNEGWIALKRNHVAFAVFQQLPSDLAKVTISEFVALLANRFYEQAAEIFVGPAWLERELILSRLAGISSQDRQLFADALDRRGYEVNVPGIARPGEPFRH